MMASAMALVTALLMAHNPPVSSKRGLIGIGVPKHPYDESRRTPAVAAASLSVPPVLVARMGGRKACRFPQGVPGTPTRSSHRLQLALGAVVFANRTPWRPHMASTHPGTATPGATTSDFSTDDEALLPGVQADAERTCLALASVMELLRGCDPSHPLSAGGLYALLEPIWGGMDTLCGDLRTVGHLGVMQ